MRKLLLFIVLFFSMNFSFANELKVIDLSKYQWEYKWGDSPFEDGIPIWTRKESEWKSITYPTNPSNRDGKTNVWYRVKLPDKLTKDPHFYAFSMDILPEVYYEGKRIYHFGEIKEDGTGKYAGWPWHMFKLPNDSAGKYLYFRIYSNYLDIGMFGEILISSKGELFERFLDKDIPKIMVGSVSIFVSVLFLLSFLSKFKRLELFILGLLFLTQGLNIICSVKILQLYLFYPLVNQFILAGSFFFFPVGIALFMDKTIRLKVQYNLIRRVWQVHLVYFFGAIIGALLGLYEIPSTYEYFDMLYYFITLPILTVFMIYFFFIGDAQTKLITFSFLIISLYWVYSFLVAYHLVPWTEYPSDVAVFLCLMLLSYSIVKRLNYTTDLEEEKEELAVLSSLDYLTKLYNRKELDKILKNCESFYKRYKDDFSIILLDIDDFKKVNDTYGHLVGDKLLVDLGSILSRYTRETDVVGRWGGEEFLVICPKTKHDEVLALAEKLRRRIEDAQFDEVGRKTASFGVSTYKGDSIISLLSKADEAMYESKSRGKNKVSYK